MVKLVDVPEMGYFSKNNQGEICAKGPSRFQGYLKDEEKTKEVIDENGINIIIIDHMQLNIY
jgi:long-chain acyl-CoA synthetase